MPDIILTRDQIENTFQALTADLTGLDHNTGVQISWPTKGRPGYKITDDIAFIQVTPIDDPIIQQRDTQYQNNDASSDISTMVYTRVHSIVWVVVGPHSMENAEAIRNGLYLASTRSILRALNLHLVYKVPAVRRAPEAFNSQWWERCDFSAQFNEKVVRYTVVPTIASAGIIIVKEDNQQEVI